ncbi:hypothetical protein Rumeso_03835 [Rubellimicrobium mesophilum DSM 19309]|uniref:Heparan-alpha-glucosaminide N-acetyltransferase catalytic domain-containing protein n=1 Tax=Rubellimicrobium mesophilum DSM 19309 TaxID=442562 RepID=A0A017HLB7_9RHOB|nr:hypothetical protein [Rubellimicrobium mesophilum]EYD74539.1 hypothetical protein Rumeso_03835 [Rubellimicrobium mesophilum DSM 19309]
MAGGGRSAALDLLKTALVAGMISAHVIQLVAEAPPEAAWRWSEFVNLVTFSGFLLAFGIGVGLSGRRRRGLGERATPVVKLLLAVWASSFGYLLLVEREPLTRGLVENVLTTRVLYGWSEFLTSFLVLYLAIAVARPLLLALGTHPRWLVAASVLGLASTMVTTHRLWPLVGGVIGHEEYPNFPLLAYLPWFLVGVHHGAGGRRVGGGDLAVGAALTGAFGLWVWQHHGRWPERFPPSVLWVVGSGLGLVAYVWVAERVAPWVPRPGLTLAAGRHVLASLVASNLAIFGVRYLWGFPVRGGWAIAAVALGLMLGVTLWAAALDRWADRRGIG